MKIIGAILTVLIIGSFLFMVWRLVTSFLGHGKPDKKKRDDQNVIDENTTTEEGK